MSSNHEIDDKPPVVQHVNYRSKTDARMVELDLLRQRKVAQKRAQRLKSADALKISTNYLEEHKHFLDDQRRRQHDALEILHQYRADGDVIMSQAARRSRRKQQTTLERPADACSPNYSTYIASTDHRSCSDGETFSEQGSCSFEGCSDLEDMKSQKHPNETEESTKCIPFSSMEQNLPAESSLPDHTPQLARTAVEVSEAPNLSVYTGAVAKRTYDLSEFIRREDSIGPNTDNGRSEVSCNCMGGGANNPRPDKDIGKQGIRIAQPPTARPDARISEGDGLASPGTVSRIKLREPQDGQPIAYFSLLSIFGTRKLYSR